MDAETLRVVVIAILIGAACLWVAATFVWRVSGTWDRVITDAERREGARHERVTFAQLGPFVTGRREVLGGHQEFSGLLVGRDLTLTRRDHGVAALAGLGFPEGVAKKLSGSVMARMKLRLSEDGLRLEGIFEPQKVEFTHQPPRVTGTYFLPGQRRCYQRVIPLAEQRRVLEEAEAPTSTGG